jgi:hypothetical protein
MSCFPSILPSPCQMFFPFYSVVVLLIFSFYTAFDLSHFFLLLSSCFVLFSFYFAVALFYLFSIVFCRCPRSIISFYPAVVLSYLFPPIVSSGCLYLSSIYCKQPYIFPFYPAVEMSHFSFYPSVVQSYLYPLYTAVFL